MNTLPLLGIYIPVDTYDHKPFNEITHKQRFANPSLKLQELEYVDFDAQNFFNLSKIPELFSVNIENWKYSFFFIHKSHTSKFYIVFSGARHKYENAVFRRQSWNYFFDGSVIYVGDPMFNQYNDLLLGWYIGNSSHNIYDNLLAIIKHIANLYGYNEILTYGSSGGGFASLKFAQIIPCKAIAINPQIYLKDYEYFERFRDITGIDCNEEFEGRINIKINPNSKYFIIQNETDKDDLNKQLFPFLKSYNILPKYGLTRYANINIWIYHALGGHNSQEDKNIFQFILYLANQLFSPDLKIDSFYELDCLACAISNIWADMRWYLHRAEISERNLSKANAQLKDISTKYNDLLKISRN